MVVLTDSLFRFPTDFMAPELFIGKDYNETVDVFSFGMSF
jgi:serine/threonine protein kinase